MVVNVASRTYDAFVTPDGFPEEPIATGLPFRNPAIQLNNKAIKQVSITTGTINVCNFNIFSGEVTIAPTNTPSPTPTPGPWYKLKDGSFTKKGAYTNQIPAVVSKYDGYDTLQPFLIANTATNDPGIVIISNPSASEKPSEKDWINSGNYSYTAPFTPATFLSYIKSRKKYRTITDLNGFNGLTSGIYIYNGTLTIDNTIAASLTNAVPILLVVTGGDVTIDTLSSVFGNPSPQSVAVLTDGILNIAPNMSELNGLFIADQIDFGNAANNPLKIVGNVISQNIAYPATRSRVDLTKPSVFIVVRPDMYLNLLPYFSTSTYEWKQLQ